MINVLASHQVSCFCPENRSTKSLPRVALQSLRSGTYMCCENSFLIAMIRQAEGGIRYTNVDLLKYFFPRFAFHNQWFPIVLGRLLLSTAVLMPFEMHRDSWDLGHRSASVTFDVPQWPFLSFFEDRLAMAVSLEVYKTLSGHFHGFDILTLTAIGILAFALQMISEPANNGFCSFGAIHLHRKVSSGSTLR